MSDLSLLAAAFAQITAADQPNPNQPEPPVIADRSIQAKHQAVLPIALTLHQASIDTYQAEFSPASAPSNVSADGPTRPSQPADVSFQVIPAAEAPPTPTIHISQPQAFETRTIASSNPVNLAETIPNILPAPVQLSLRPILTRQGGSISAVPPKVRPIALRLHEASIETYANTLALASLPGQASLAQEVEAKQPSQHLQTGAQHRLPQRIAASPPPQSPTLTATVSLSPAALALGMAQAAGAAQSIADANVSTSVVQATLLQEQSKVSLYVGKPTDRGTGSLQTNSLLAGAPVVVASAVDAPPEKTSAAQAAIALDRLVRNELEQESIAVSQAQQQATSDSPLWASPGATATSSAASNAKTTVQLSPEAVAQANAAPGSPSSPPEPSIPIPPKQAIAAAPLASRTAPRPSLSPLQLPQPKNGPRSGPQLYQQRLAALKQGRLYSRLPIDSFKAIWQGVRHKPSYGQWKRLLAAEARAVGGGQGNNRLSIVLGDSLSLWLPMQQLPSSQLWLNQGISGDTTTGILNRLAPLKDTRPSNIYVMAGVNDLKNGATDAQVAQNLQQIMRHLRQQHPQAQIHVQSILPASIGLAPGRIRNLNDRIARIAQMERVAFLDIYPQFVAPNGQMMAQLTTDGIHLSPQGYALWQSILHRMAEPWAFANGGGLLGRS